MTKSIALALILSAAWSSGVCADPDTNRFRPPNITISGSAARDVVPDAAILRFSIRAEKPTSPAAADEVGTLSKAVVEELESKGIERRYIRSTLNVAAVYDEEHGSDGRVTKRTLRGYQATVSVAVRVNDTGRVRTLAREVIAKGANIFQGIDFIVTEEKSPLDDLRVEATKSALRMAKLYTEAAGVHLGGILSIEPDSGASEGMADLPRPAMPRSRVVETEIPIEPGMQTIQSNVRITWEIVP